jgi:hypothetical protein
VNFISIYRSTYPGSEALTEEEVCECPTEWNKERRQHDKHASGSERDTEQADVEQPSDDEARKEDDAVLLVLSAGVCALRKAHILGGIQSRHWFCL